MRQPRRSFPSVAGQQSPRLPQAQPQQLRRRGSGQPPSQYLVEHHQPFLFFLVQYHLIHLGDIFAFLL
jgi:hypothetical protein